MNKELDDHTRSVNTGFCTGKLTVIWHLLLRKSEAALGLPREQLCKTNTRWHKTKQHKQEQLPISACSLQYPMQPPRQDWMAQTLLPTFPLSTSPWSSRHGLVATAENLWQLWRQWEMTAAGSTQTRCHSLPSPLPPCSCYLNCRVPYSRMLSLAYWSSIRLRPQALGAALHQPLWIFLGANEE